MINVYHVTSYIYDNGLKLCKINQINLTLISKYIRLYLVQEFCCGGELFRRMEFERLMLEKDAKFYLSEIVVALEYLHQKVSMPIALQIQFDTT